MSAISKKLSKNIQIKKAKPRATSDDFTTDDTKNAIPRNEDESENNNPVYKKIYPKGCLHL